MSGGIFFDARYIRPEVHDGISRFSANLCAALAQTTSVTAIISDDAQLTKLPAGIAHVKLHAPTSALEPFSALILNKFKPDVVFSPMQTIGSLGRKFKLILTVHDLIYYRHPKPPSYLAWPIRIGWRLFHLSYLPERLLLRGCEAVATVSESTAQELRANRLTKKPIRVVYNAPEASLVQKVEAKRDKTLLYMGTFMPYKNVETLIRGVAALPDYKLLLLSRIDEKRSSELKALAKSVGANVEFCNGVTDDEYAQMLDRSTALVSASQDEGFGIPLVEAMVRGVPIVVSDIPIFREVAGEAGRYFDAKNPTEFAKQVMSLEFDAPKANELETQARKFDWEASAASLKGLIHSL